MNLVQQYVHLDLDAVAAVTPEQIDTYLCGARWVRAEAISPDLQAWTRPASEPLPGHLQALCTLPARQARLIWSGYVSSPVRRRRDYAARVEELLLVLGMFERRLASAVLSDIATVPVA
ncbi:hypothetical protein [Streptomyces sp. CAU 1734]|uniref:hypothetical protein n=1 Tax=Streptomyces sp. CAU 1734 TaxID=3140360 RepID=UPI00325FEED2